MSNRLLMVKLCNAGLMAASILALGDPALAERLAEWRKAQTDSVANEPS